MRNTNRSFFAFSRKTDTFCALEWAQEANFLGAVFTLPSLEQRSLATSLGHGSTWAGRPAGWAG